ncbi:MAG TPA: hypothetical protein VGW34_12080 [Allosphingosinicella sp.]|nr:hypothetical protein [Allosphingosinicella sp.]
MRRALPALLLLLAPAWLPVQPLTVSPGPEAVSVTVYRGGGGEMDLEWLEGYALVTETRTVDLPAGPSELRFQGVAGGIIPVSAIVSGLPGGVTEKNRDARLLSPGGLVDAALGKRVHIRRTSRATGRVTETEAVLRSGPDGVVLQTAEGFEALRCTGLPETLVYEAVPDGLTDRPTLAVRTISAAAARATLRLSYLATDFDWRANYVINMAPDGRRLDLFAWLTLANGNDESFVAAQTQAVAGAPNKEDEEDLGESQVPAEIRLQCWPAGTTTDLPLVRPPVPGALEEYAMGNEAIIVTGSRLRQEFLMANSPVTVITAEQEELGDLKLYRIPEPVTVSAHAQKQVALLTKPRVRFERLYGADLNAQHEGGPEPATLLLRLKNEKKHGLGVPLPSGVAAVFETVSGRPMLAGEALVEDTAVGQELDLRVGESTQIMVVQRKLDSPAGRGGAGEAAAQRYEVEITNAHPRSVVVETLLRIYGEEWRLARPSRKLGMRNGRHMWRAKVPANGRLALSYVIERISEPPSANRMSQEEEEHDN